MIERLPGVREKLAQYAPRFVEVSFVDGDDSLISSVVATVEDLNRAIIACADYLYLRGIEPDSGNVTYTGYCGWEFAGRKMVFSTLDLGENPGGLDRSIEFLRGENN